MQVYPGLMLTSGLIHYVLNSLHITIDIRNVCVFLAPFFSGLTAIATFLFTREVWNEKAGLLAACCIAIGMSIMYIFSSVCNMHSAHTECAFLSSQI